MVQHGSETALLLLHEIFALAWNYRRSQGSITNLFKSSDFWLNNVEPVFQNSKAIMTKLGFLTFLDIF